MNRAARCRSLLLAIALLVVGASPALPGAPASVWPALTRQARPWTYWWWMGSAVDKTNLTRELQRYHDAGLGGVHIIPIYGARGYENQFIPYLSPHWMEMLAFTMREARHLDLGVDMTLGTGWCFGGPHVTDLEANALVQVKTFSLAAGARLTERFSRDRIQALVAYSPEGRALEVTDKLKPDGTLNWTPATGTWTIFAITQRPSGQKVKRAAPGGQGWMLNLFYAEAMRHYLEWFDGAFSHYSGPRPRALYHDSYEYRCDWAPDFFESFERRRGYRLQTELPALFAGHRGVSVQSPGFDDPDRIARVKSDYRETVSDIMAEQTLPAWTHWAHAHGFLTRNEAHGSPGNWLDFYAVADIPETEMFHLDRNKLVSKFASSAAHVTGKNLVGAETGTWLNEHFTGTLADMKYLVDEMFLSGVNHVFYHGTCYSPDSAPWPGWTFYASFDMNPRNSIWRDVPCLNAYVARCQAVLQSGHPDNDLLVYWPIYDLWHDPKGMIQPLTVHARSWFEDQPLGVTAEHLWQRGYAFDYVSDRQLATAKVDGQSLRLPGGHYRAVVLPPTRHLPLRTLRKLLALATAGATVIFQDRLPEDVPGWGRLEQRRAEFKDLLGGLRLAPEQEPHLRRHATRELRIATVRHGRVLVGRLDLALHQAGIPREPMFDHPGLMCVRRAFDGGHDYFVANRSADKAVHGWMPLAREAKSAIFMDPLKGETGLAALRHNTSDATEVYLALEPGQSCLLRCFSSRPLRAPAWTNWSAAGRPVPLRGLWTVRFLAGGPEIPSPLELQHLDSWTDFTDTNAQRFAGTALYTTTFDAPPGAPGPWRLDLGKVCQSARVRLNGKPLGTLITAPFVVFVGTVKPTGNRLEVEVTNVAANRIRDLDRRKVPWKRFYDINMVNIDYKPFDASNWPLTDSGLLGPVTLTPVTTKTEN